MATAQDFINIAESQLGTCESPAGSNRVKYAEWYGMNGQPWCDMFVSWCANQVGALDIVGKYAYCPYHVSFFKNKGQWLDREEKPQPGDIVFFANKGTACHVGIVVSRNGSSSVTTIEGNTSAGNNANGGQVQKRTRTYGSVGSSWYILGFGRPAWNGSTTASTPSTDTTATTTTTTSIDMTPDNVAEVQAYMNKVYGCGLAVDNIFGSKTKAAIVKEVQRIIGTTVDGIFGNNSKAAWGSRIIQKGSTGNLARLCQMMLICRGFGVGNCGADGDVGNDTANAIYNFQAANNLSKDKQLGKNTAAKLFG